MKHVVGRWHLALGIDWLMLSGPREARAAKKQRPKEMFAQAAYTGQRWLGFHEPIAGKKVYAAAMLVAMVKPNAVVFCPVNEVREGDSVGYSDAWVCAVHQGMPVPGYDRIEPIEQARQTAHEWISLFPDSELTGELGSGYRLDDVLQTLDEGLQARAIQKREIDRALLHARGLPLAMLAKSAAVGAVVGGGYLGMHAYNDWQQRRQAEEVAAQTAQRAAVAEASRRMAASSAYQAKLRAFGEQVAQERSRIQAAGSMVAFWNAFTALRQSLPLSQQGFRPDVIECIPQNCRVTWHAVGRFASAAGRFALPGVKPTLDTDLTATSEFDLPASRGALGQRSAASLEAMRFMLKTQFAARQLTLDLTDPQPVTVRPPEGLSVAPVTLAQIGTWRLSLPSNSALLDAPQLIGYLSEFPMSLTAIRYQGAGGAASIQLEGQLVYFMETEAGRGL